MYSTLDILLTDKKDMVSDLMEEWESELAKHGKPKLKFPLKVTEPDLDNVDLNFQEPVIKDPEKKKHINKAQVAKVVDLPKKRGSNKKDKTKLF